MRRVSTRLGIESEVDDAAAWVAGLEYLAIRVANPDAQVSDVAIRHDTPSWRVMHILGDLRDASAYRAYVGEWIREGCPAFIDEVEPEPMEEGADAEELPLFADLDIGVEPEEDLDDDAPVAERQPAPGVELAPFASESGPPTRWQAPFTPYDWQLQAVRAWEENQGCGIMQVVTGAGKTALAIYLYGRLLDRLQMPVDELQAIVVVPRIELAHQWAREFRRLLDLRGIRIGEYHSGHKCLVNRQDILIITQDSARREIPRMRFDRPVLLVADECHRLGAPAASRVLARDFTWTLGLSATPERTGDSGFEEILVPRLGPVVWKYGYRDAVRDGIIARFTVVRVKVAFTPDEEHEYNQHSERITRLLDALKRAYPMLRRVPPGRFWQVMGDLKRRHRDDDRFEVLTAVASERRAIVHYAQQKYDAVSQLTRELGHPRRVLCFHERIEAADRLVTICTSAGRASAVYHSQIAEPVRGANLARFRRGEADWLIACRSLDEGLDIPAVDTVVIVAGTKSPRQLIQRLGRALRRKGDDRPATVVLIEVAGIDDKSLGHEVLEELTEAAEEIVELQLPELTAWLRERSAGSDTEASAPTSAHEMSSRVVQGQPGSAARASVTAASAPTPPSRKTERSWLDQVRRLGSGLTHRISSSWTGSDGNRSYYDKDSSPD